jgi:hypothetical protein
MRGWVGAFSPEPPNCVTVKIVPPTWIVPIRFAPVVFFCVANVNEVAVDFTVSQVAAVDAVHVQPAVLATSMAPEVPAFESTVTLVEVNL